MAAHLRTFLKECGSFAHTIFPGKHYHLRTLFSQVNVTFAHIRFSQVTGMFALARLHRQANPSFPVKAADTSCLMVQYISDTQTGIVMFRTETNNQDVHLFGDVSSFAQNISTSCIQFMRTKMDSVFHVCFFLLPSKI